MRKKSFGGEKTNKYSELIYPGSLPFILFLIFLGMVNVKIDLNRCLD